MKKLFLLCLALAAGLAFGDAFYVKRLSDAVMVIDGVAGKSETEAALNLKANTAADNITALTWRNALELGVTHSPVFAAITAGSGTITNLTADAFVLDGESIYSVPFSAEMTNSPTHAISGAGILAVVMLTSGVNATSETLPNLIDKVGGVVDVNELTTGKLFFETYGLIAQSTDADPDISGVDFYEVPLLVHEGESVYESGDWADGEGLPGKFFIWSTNDVWWISAEVGSPEAGWTNDSATVYGEFTAWNATGTVTVVDVKQTTELKWLPIERVFTNVVELLPLGP